MIRIDLAGNRLSIYDIEEIVPDRRQNLRRPAAVAVLTPTTKQAVDSVLKPYVCTDKRDPSEELAELRDLHFRWGSLQFYETPLIPEGTILFINTADFPTWKEQLEASAAITGIGMGDA